MAPLVFRIRGRGNTTFRGHHGLVLTVVVQSGPVFGVDICQL